MLNSDYELSIMDVANLLGVTRQAVSQFFKPKAGALARGNKKNASVPPDVIRSYLEITKGYTYKKQAIAFQIVKGGVGKSSLSKNFAIRASMYGYKVLLIDFDHQLNLTVSMNAFHEDNLVWLDYLRKKTTNIFDLVKPINSHLSIIPSSPKNCLMDKEIILGAANLSNLIADPINQLFSEFDLIVVDCPPALTHLTHAIYLSVDRIIAPVKPDVYSKLGLEQVFNQWEEISSSYKKNPEINILVNMYDPRIKASTSYLQQFYAQYANYMIPNLIRQSSEFVSSMEDQEHLWTKRATQAGEDLDVIVKHILNLYEVSSTNSKKKSDLKEEEAEL
ncbi:ParA family protein [Fluviispira sanaruensis]|uniref:Chromosome partitioning protein ParA n=1 Tax=Fluviispira sanaruensis TaxID=2493639 RepID=A0A4P2W0B6_FLUSA|nr:ParA family protein [Fluviispira sanaruensis]BBH54612.1 chromosome partitioning protein ParA [Fluviispira sanaruensis]